MDSEEMEEVWDEMWIVEKVKREMDEIWMRKLMEIEDSLEEELGDKFGENVDMYNEEVLRIEISIYGKYEEKLENFVEGFVEGFNEEMKKFKELIMKKIE
jgi:hypothetical protein